MAAFLYDITDGIPEYFSERKDFDFEKFKKSTCLYIGNLSYFTTELQIFELFSRCGEINRIIMGLNKQTKTPCGFCFVEYMTKESARVALNSLNKSILDNRQIRVDLDTGFEEGRQYGRGISGSQKRDELINKFDPERPNDKKYLGYKKKERDNNYKNNYYRDRDGYRENYRDNYYRERHKDKDKERD